MTKTCNQIAGGTHLDGMVLTRSGMQLLNTRVASTFIARLRGLLGSIPDTIGIQNKNINKTTRITLPGLVIHSGTNNINRTQLP
jgi:hypothetical protein